MLRTSVLALAFIAFAAGRTATTSGDGTTGDDQNVTAGPASDDPAANDGDTIRFGENVVSLRADGSGGVLVHLDFGGDLPLPSPPEIATADENLFKVKRDRAVPGVPENPDEFGTSKVFDWNIKSDVWQALRKTADGKPSRSLVMASPTLGSMNLEVDDAGTYLIQIHARGSVAFADVHFHAKAVGKKEADGFMVEGSLDSDLSPTGTQGVALASASFGGKPIELIAKNTAFALHVPAADVEQMKDVIAGVTFTTLEATPRSFTVTFKTSTLQGKVDEHPYKVDETILARVE